MAENTEQHISERPAPLLIGDKISWYRDWVVLVTVPAVLAIDQVSKYLIRTNLYRGESWPESGLFRLTYGTNTGAAFGMFTNFTPLLIVASLFAIGFLIYFYRTHAFPHPLLRLAIGLILGGAVGNLIDRVRAGTVVDFIDVGPWPIFNLADSSIVVGITLLIGILLLTDWTEPDEPDEHTPDQHDSAGT